MGKKKENADSSVNEPASEYAFKTYSIHEAKTSFSKLVKRAAAGETIFIGSYGKPEAVLKTADQRKINAELRAAACGCMKGEIQYEEGWDHWTDEELYKMFYNFMTWEEFKKL